MQPDWLRPPAHACVRLAILTFRAIPSRRLVNTARARCLDSLHRAPLLGFPKTPLHRTKYGARDCAAGLLRPSCLVPCIPTALVWAPALTALRLRGFSPPCRIPSPVLRRDLAPCYQSWGSPRFCVPGFHRAASPRRIATLRSFPSRAGLRDRQLAPPTTSRRSVTALHALVAEPAATFTEVASLHALARSSCIAARAPLVPRGVPPPQEPYSGTVFPPLFESPLPWVVHPFASRVARTCRPRSLAGAHPSRRVWPTAVSRRRSKGWKYVKDRIRARGTLASSPR